VHVVKAIIADIKGSGRLKELPWTIDMILATTGGWEDTYTLVVCNELGFRLRIYNGSIWLGSHRTEDLHSRTENRMHCVGRKLTEM